MDRNDGNIDDFNLRSTVLTFANTSGLATFTDWQQQEEDTKVKESELIRGNSLLNPTGSYEVERRWDEDVVFKNQARGEPKPVKRFLNDTIRNDFNRKFLTKYK